MKQSLRSLAMVLIVGLGLFGFLAILTFGTPFRFDYPYTPRSSLSTVGYTYEPLFVGVDLLFWIGVAFVLVSIADRVSAKWADDPFLRYDERAKVKFFAALLFFVSAILSLWVGLSNHLVGFSGWYLGASVFAICGIIVLRLPAALGGNNANDGAR